VPLAFASGAQRLLGARDRLVFKFV